MGFIIKPAINEMRRTDNTCRGMLENRCAIEFIAMDYLLGLKIRARVAIKYNTLRRIYKICNNAFFIIIDFGKILIGIGKGKEKDVAGGFGMKLKTSCPNPFTGFTTILTVTARNGKVFTERRVKNSLGVKARAEHG